MPIFSGARVIASDRPSTFAITAVSYEERIDTVTGPRSRNARAWQVGQLPPEAR
jgi:hypothetical protein